MPSPPAPLWTRGAVRLTCGILVVAAVIAVYACTSQRVAVRANPVSWTALSAEEAAAAFPPRRAKSVDPAGCGGNAVSIPDTNHLGFWPIKTVRLAVHVLYQPSRPVPIDSSRGARTFDAALGRANAILREPKAMWMPADDPAPAWPSRMRYALAEDPDGEGPALYFHADDEIPYHVHRGRNINIGNRAAYRRYAESWDSVLHVIGLSHDPDSLASTTYMNSSSGVALGNRFIKLVHHWEDAGQLAPHAVNLLHEGGHIYGLAHAWGRDGCEDTPQHSGKCWNFNEPPGCTEVSNNLMDYSAHASTFTPCQIGRMHARMGDVENLARTFLEPAWCEGRPGGRIVLRDSFTVRHEADVEGSIELMPGAYLDVACRLSVPAGDSIIVHAGATLRVSTGRLHNSCGLPWAGVFVVGKAPKRVCLEYGPEATFEGALGGVWISPAADASAAP